LHTASQIDDLEDLLDSLELMPDAMSVSELDGFVAGLLLCPEMIDTSEWLPEVWGMDCEPEFDSPEQAKAVISAVMAHYNRVAVNLANRSEPYEIVLEYPDNEVIEDDEPFWEFWIAGFNQAFQLREHAWDLYWQAEDDNVTAAMSLFGALMDLEAGDSFLDEDKQDALAMEAPNIIPGLVVTMNNWLKAQALAGNLGGEPEWLQAANANAGPARSTKVGRNDPCPCGSGRKYKKCCGSN
jgi:uncharacterized protein